jgi:hypothetical protein
MLERSLQKAVLNRLRKLAQTDQTLTFRKRHGSPFVVAGDPDIYGLYRGVHFEIELKRERETPTKLQDMRMGEWGRAGALTWVVRSMADFDIFWAHLQVETASRNG